tara:strand:- start:514 stop:894 length:381 start_codon:yes stop_codon:yes gene_type:complete
MPTVLENISLDVFKSMLSSLSHDKIIIIRFTAEWCKPCKNIDPLCTKYFSNCNNNIIPILIDIDEALDIYASLKRYKMVNGIPALMAYFGNQKNDHWFVCNDMVNSGNVDSVNQFLTRCELRAKKI